VIKTEAAMMLSKLSRRSCGRKARATAAAAARQCMAEKGFDVNNSMAIRHFHKAVTLQSFEVKMPSLSPTMQEGQIVKWLKAEGEAVSAGDVICDIQTDKAVVSLETDEDGVLAKIIKNQDDGTITIGSLIAVIAEEGEDWKEVAKDAATAGGEEEPVAAAADAPAAAAAMPTGGSTPGTEVNMPALSPTMTEGTIVKWCVQEGEKISAGDVLCEIQTDKAVVSMEIDDDCVLAKILVPEGESNVKIGSLIALTVDEGEDWKDVQIPAQTAGASADSNPAAEAPAASAAPAAPAAGGGVEQTHVHVPGVGPATNLLLALYGINPSNVEASGPKGLTKNDVMTHIEQNNLKPLELSAAPPGQVAGGGTAAPAAASVATGPKSVTPDGRVKRPTFDRPASVKRMESGPSRAGSARYTDVPLTSMRSVIAKRLLQSKQTSPHGHATAEANIDAITQIRKDFANAGVKISVNDLVIKAASTALQYVPEININSVGEDDFQVMPNVDISVAVATDSGLITPIVKDVPSLSLGQISDTVRELAGKAKAGKLQLNEFQGGTFTISNLGMFGITEFTAIINPPQGAILAVGKGMQEMDPATMKPVTLMRATLSFDRRFIDEHLAAEFMATFRRVLENPQYMNIGPVPLVRANASAAGGLY